MDWAWSTGSIRSMHRGREGWKVKQLAFLCLPTAFFNYLTKFLPFHAEIVLPLVCLSPIAWNYLLYLIFCCWIVHHEPHKLSISNLQLNWVSLFNFSLLFYLGLHNCAVNQSCLFHYTFHPVRHCQANLTSKQRSPVAKLIPTSFVKVSGKIRETWISAPFFQGRLQTQLSSYLLHLACQQSTEDVYGLGLQSERVSGWGRDGDWRYRGEWNWTWQIVCGSTWLSP